MPDKCCVPECISNYESSKGGYVTVFKFPSDPEMHAKWVTCIPRKNWNPSKRSVVCINHFETDDVLKCDVYKEAEGNEITFPRARPKLKDTAVPRLFPNLPKYLSKPAGSFSGIARTNPDDRRRKADEELQRKNEQWLADDVISGFNDLCERCENKIRDLNKWQKVVFSDFVCFYQMCFQDIPKVVKSVKVDDTLSVQICVGNYIVSSSELKWILPSSLKLTRWSQLENILLRYVHIDSMNENSNEDSLVRLKQCLTFLEGKSEVLDNSSIDFLCEQLLLSGMMRKQYSVNMLLYAFLIYEQSRAAYSALRLNNILCLPHPKHLQNLISSFCISPTNASNNAHFLTSVASKIIELEKLVILQLDEIHVNPKFQFKGGKITGCAENSLESEPAKTVQAFLVSSAFGNMKEIVSLYPVKGMTGQELYEKTLEVLSIVISCGLKVFTIICDNNAVNRSLFTKLTSNSESTYYFTFPTADAAHTIYVMFDTVHMFKNVRNNWLNLHDNDKTFYFPSFSLTGSDVLEAKFVDLRNLYKSECNMTPLMKAAPKLNYKSVYPTPIERQNVNFTNNVFHETTIAALLCFDVKSEATAQFVKIIGDWWRIVNIKNPVQGFTENDPRLQFLQNFNLWLDKWQSIEKEGKLSRETHKALYHTNAVLIELISVSLKMFGVKYVLTGKFQTDILEGRFGMYRQLSGANYHISFTQLLESEKKMRVKSLLGLSSAKYGSINFLPQILSTVTEPLQDSDQDTSEFLGNNQFEELCLQIVNENDTVFENPAFLYICGYVAYKTEQKVSCKHCVSMITSESCNSLYFDILNKGGLTAPSSNVVRVCHLAWSIMSALISEKFEAAFLKVRNHKQLLLQVLRQLVSSDIDLSFFDQDYCLCGKPLSDIREIILNTISNILINNYTKHKNDSLVHIRQTNKKRKLEVFQGKK